MTNSRLIQVMPPILLIAVLFIIASCVGPAKWRNPDLPVRQWAVDRAACEGKARRELDKQYNRQNMLNAGDEINGSSSYESNMAQYTDHRQMAILSGKCLKKMGYEPAP